MSKIKSKNQLTLGQIIEKPPRATHIYDANGAPIYTCPHCRHVLSEDDCDCIGAEPGCLFCNNCSGEFET